MKVEKNKVVALSYTLTVEGKVADQASSDSPLEYIHAKGMLLPKFEAELEGKSACDDFAFTLSPEDGYGTHNPGLVLDLPKSAFSVDGQVREDLLMVGNVIPMMDNKGNMVQGVVCQVDEASVTMDFNHPMAGKTLNFSGKIESVREATQEELENGLQRKCRCHKGDKDSNCDGDCSCDGSCDGGCDCDKK